MNTTTKNNRIAQLLQISGGTFPSGGFSQSWGLETYVDRGIVCDEKSFTDFAEVFMENTLGRCEGPVMCEAYRLAGEWDEEEILKLENLSRAVKLTKESREASLRMGKAILRIMSDVLEDDRLESLRKVAGKDGMTYPVVYGIVCCLMDIDLEDGVSAFVYSSINALAQSGIKLIPLGNTQAQVILYKMQDRIVEVSEAIMQRSVGEISNFCPALDIAGIVHESLAVRLYMS